MKETHPPPGLSQPYSPTEGPLWSPGAPAACQCPLASQTSWKIPEQPATTTDTHTRTTCPKAPPFRASGPAPPHPSPPIMSRWRQPHPVTSYWDGPAPITSYWDGPAPCYVILGSISLELEGKFSCVGWLLLPWRPLSPGGASCLGKQRRKSHRKEQLQPFCETGQQWQCQEAEGGVLSWSLVKLQWGHERCGVRTVGPRGQAMH